MISMGLLTNIIILFFNISTYLTNGVALYDMYTIEPGPQVIPTKGEVWPLPRKQESVEHYFTVSHPDNFYFQVVNNECDILKIAIVRYKQSINKQYLHSQKYPIIDPNINATAKLLKLKINLTEPCEEYPHLYMDEQYSLKVSSDAEQCLLMASSIWGVLRGLETFSQLIFSNNRQLIIRENTITDYPQYTHRGLLLDTSRHFIPVRTIKKILRAMSYDKMNVFHWHIVDDPSFPYQSEVLPLLSKGAFYPTMVYKLSDIRKLIEYGRILGIRVLPEIDMPGHSRSWGVGYIDVLTKCYRNNQPSGEYGAINPINEYSYDFINKLFNEVLQLFPERFIHLGADEVNFGCWQSNPNITQYMKDNNINDYVQLESLFMNRVINIAGNLSAEPIVWEEVFNQNINVPNNTIVQVWRTENTLDSVTKKYRGLLSSCYYLDQLKNGGDWTKYYDCEPSKYVSTSEQQKMVLGGEACMWGEVIDVNNVLSRIWPRSSAVAEKLWSAAGAQSSDQAKHRLEEHACRLNQRGIPAQPPNGPGFCI